MRDVTDNRTGELEVGEVKRGRGRPRKADAMTNAERQAAYRARQRQSVTVTKKVPTRLIVDQVDAYDECRLEVDQLRAELAEVKQREEIAWREMRQQRDAREVLSREVADLNREFVQLVDERSKAFAENDRLRAELAAAKKGAAKSVTRNENQGTVLYAEIKRSSKYYGQTGAGELFRVGIFPAGEYVVQGGPGGQYRLKDVWLWAVEADGKKVRLG